MPFEKGGRIDLEETFALVCTSFDNGPDCGDFAAYLHPRELEKIQNAVDKRRAEFFCGRLCAKRAYARLRGGCDPDADLCTESRRACVLNDCRGAPFFEDGRFAVSITHGDGLAAALVTDRQKLLAGLDLQKMTPRGVQTIYRYLKDPEKALIDRYDGQYGRAFCVTAAWVAKEAASKLLGCGFSVFDALEPSGFEDGGAVRVRFKNFGGLSAVIRPYRDFLFGFAVETKNAALFFEDRLEICETPLAKLKNPR
jgi:Phosphopantetheinyl transferase component of siderophore synthetase